MKWRFWIDVGGTFTDCLATAPDGRSLQSKVLSSGLTKGTIDRFESEEGMVVLVSHSFSDSPDGFWNGAKLRFVDDKGQTIAENRVKQFRADLRDSSFLLTQPIDRQVTQTATGIEIDAGVHAPVVAIHRAMGIAFTDPLTDPLPDCEVQLGTTRGTNALLTRTGASVALVTSTGFRDLLEIGDQSRPNLFDLNIQKLKPLYCRAVEIEERVLADGTVRQPINEANVRAVLKQLKQTEVSSVAVCLMHSFRFPEHERQVGRIARDIGFTDVRLSHEVAPLIKIIPRAETTVLDAYLNPVIGDYLDEIKAQLSPDSSLRLMTSAGGLVMRENFSGKDSVLSGPAGGVVGAARVAQQAGFEKMIGFDMGGTSTDVSRFDGDFETEFESRKAGVRIVAPMLAIETVAAGGGSVCHFDGVRLQVGPQSAGSDPGPACYGRGGPLTVTDMNLFLGRIETTLFPFELHIKATTDKIVKLCADLKLAGHEYSPRQLAAGFLEIANHNMATAIENVSVRKGYDPKEYALMSFGGAGSQHCCAVADRLEMATIIDHPQSSILSAVGISMADENAHAVKSILRPVAEMTQAELDSVFAELETEVTSRLGRDAQRTQAPRLILKLELRYRSMDAALTVDSGTIETALRLFEDRHQEFFGYLQDRSIELVAARCQAVVDGDRRPPITWPVASQPPKSDFPSSNAAPQSLDMPSWLRSELTAGQTVDGPAIIADKFSTTIVDQGWRALVGPESMLKIQKIAQVDETDEAKAAQNVGVPSQADPVQLEIFNRKFSGIAAQMGLVLQKTSISVNVKERLDFSCAIFTAVGNLVVNAPHIPVHLGAMSDTVRKTIALNSIVSPGDVFVTNDPYGGGSHLPDVTVVSPVFDQSGAAAKLLFWVASRSHHAEIGGKTPGSMPPDATCLAEEGVLIANLKLVNRGVPNFEQLKDLLCNNPWPSRNVDENLADIRAQIAANQSGSHDLLKLVGRHGAERVLAYMGFIQQAAANQTRDAILKLSAGEHRFSDALDNGATIKVCISVSGQSMKIDFAGTDDVLTGNQNANPAIVSSAVMYVLRMLIQTDIPLNEGVIEPVAISIPENCFLNPVPGETPRESPAIVGGNVETSQRIVDVLLGALGIAAASQGTMNNWLMGDDSFGYYETIGGGSGATSSADGASAVHVHMTNTRLTDPEILETRYPVVLREFSVRRGSGGTGQHCGGDGMVRAVEFLKPLSVSLLTNRRNCRPYGLKGGQAGKPGRNLLIRSEQPPVDLESQAQLDVQPGDVLRIETPGGGGYSE